MCGGRNTVVEMKKKGQRGLDSFHLNYVQERKNGNRWGELNFLF